MTTELLQDNLRVFVVPVEILEVEGLSIYEKMAYIVIRSHANVRDASAFPSYATIAKEASMSRRKAIDAVSALVEKGLLRKETRLSVSKNRKIRNTSNMYYIERPAAVQPSAQDAPPLVNDVHQGSAQHAPEHNHLKESFRTTFDCMGAASEIDPIFESLNKNVPVYCYVEGIPLTDAYIREIYTMLANQFPNQLAPEVVEIASELYFERACLQDGSRVRMKLDVQNPVGYFRFCYEDAIKQYKLKRGKSAQK